MNDLNFFLNQSQPDSRYPTDVVQVCCFFGFSWACEDRGHLNSRDGGRRQQGHSVCPTPLELQAWASLVKGNKLALAGNRTRVNCLGSSYANHYTTNAFLRVSETTMTHLFRADTSPNLGLHCMGGAVVDGSLV